MPTYSTLYNFLPLPYSQRNRAIDDELLIDNDKGTLYMKSDEEFVNITIKNIEDVLQTIRNTIVGNVDVSDINLRTLYSEIHKILEWINTIDNPTDSTLDFILQKIQELRSLFEDMEAIFDSKVDKVEGLGLSKNNFSQVLKTKLDGIEERANLYSHPIQKQCNFTPSVVSVNGRTGRVTLTVFDINLGTIDPYANNYIHPIEKQCDVRVVESVNGKSGDVVITKADVDLSEVKNHSLGGFVVPTGVLSEGYSTPKINNDIISRYIKNKFYKCVHLTNNTHLGLDKDRKLIYVTDVESFNLNSLFGIDTVVDFHINDYGSAYILDSYGYGYICTFYNDKTFGLEEVSTSVKNVMLVTESIGYINSDTFGCITKNGAVKIFNKTSVVDIPSEIGPTKAKPVHLRGYGDWICVVYENGKAIFYKNVLNTADKYTGNTKDIQGVLDIQMSKTFSIYIDYNNTCKNNTSSTILNNISNINQISCSSNTACAVGINGSITIYGRSNIYNLGRNAFYQAFCYKNSIVGITDRNMSITW